MASEGAKALERTPLFEEHQKLGAKLVGFAGYEMPVRYEGIKAEHEAVRNHVGLFDVSHMGEIELSGPDAEATLQRLLTRDVSRLEEGQVGYAAVCYESGGTMDDVLVYRYVNDEQSPEDSYMVVTNAANREEDFEHFRRNSGGLDVRLIEDSDNWALMALQGPQAQELLQRFTDVDLSSLGYYRFVEAAYLGDGVANISRTGYTGEDGFELFVLSDSAPRAWRQLIEAGATPAGLGARDTLRLEAGMCLYGNELDAGTTPLEAGIGFAVHLDKEEEFIGQEALKKENAEGSRKKLVGFEVEGRGIARHGHEVAVNGEVVGKVTSGTLSPTLNKAIGLATVSPGVEDSFEVVIRDRPVAARVVPLPFYNRRRKH